MSKGSISTDSGKLLKKYFKVFVFGWIAVILILGLSAFGFWFNDFRKSEAEVSYWHQVKSQVGKETTIRQINEYNYNK